LRRISLRAWNKEAPPKAGQGIMLGALSGQPLGIGGL
jgi:hypothetical protein